jgi:alkylhydroperoxidase/carboxymuconolactone decarboxylase family protein YurZ
MPELDADARRLAERMFEPRGYIHEWHLYLAQRRPEMLDLWEQLTRTANRTSTLPGKYRECVYVGVLSAVGEEQAAKNHMHKALDLGATEQELLDAVMAAFNPTGAITMVHGIKALVEVLVERGLYTLPDVPWRVTDRAADAERTYLEDAGAGPGAGAGPIAGTGANARPGPDTEGTAAS